MLYLVLKFFSKNWNQTVISVMLIVCLNLLTSPPSAANQKTQDEPPKNTALIEYMPLNLERLDDNTKNMAPADITTKASETITTTLDNDLVILTILIGIQPTTQNSAIEIKPNEKAKQIENAELSTQQPLNTIIAYIIIDGAGPTALKELVKKTFNKFMRNMAFAGDYKAAFNPVEAGIRIRRSFAELPRNTNRLILTEKAKENYQEIGKIIRTSLVGHTVIAIFQVGVGLATTPFFVYLGLPPEVGAMAGDYLKWSSFGVLTKEFTGKTGENILMIEHPEMEFLPAIINSVLMMVIYYGPSQTLNIGTLPRLAISEASSMGITSVLLLGFLNYDEQYQKYKLSDFTHDTPSEYWNTLMQIKDYSIPVFISCFSFAAAESANILMDAMLGGVDALKTRGTFTLLSLAISPFYLANAQQSGRLIAKSLANNDYETTIKYKMRQDLLTNLLVSTPYLMVILKPNLIYTGERNPMQDGVVRVLATSNILLAIESMAKDQLSAFKTAEQSWLKTAGDITTAVVPIVGVILFRTGAIDSNLQNRLIIQAISLLPIILTISEAFGGPSLQNYQP